MESTADRRIAFERADAIMALEGFERTSEMVRIQEAVLAGRTSFEEAVRAIVADAQQRAGGATDE